MSSQQLPDSASLSSVTPPPDAASWTEQTRLLKMVLEGCPADRLLPAIAGWIEQQSFAKVHVLIGIADRFGQHITKAYTASLPYGIVNAVEQQPVALFTASLPEEEELPDLDQHPYWQPVAHLLKNQGIVSLITIPLINSEEQIAGLVFLFLPATTQYGSTDRELIALAGNMILLSLSRALQSNYNQQLIEREKIAREEVNKAEMLAQLAVDGAGAGTFNVNLTDNYIEYSPLLAKILTGQYTPGLSRNALIENIHPADKDIRDEAYRLATQTGRLSYEVRFIWHDGSIHWIKAMGTYLPGADGRDAHFAGIVLDITPEIKAREEQQRLLALVENSADYMAIGNKEGKLLYINEAGKQLLGIMPDQDTSNLTNRDFASPEELERVKRDILPIVTEKGTWSGTIHLRHFKTGENIPCHAEYTSITDPKTGEYLGRGATMRDLRPELAARQALQESEQRFRSMIEKAPIAMGVLKGDQLIVEVCNQEMLAFWNKTPAVIGLPFEEALPEIKGQPFPDMMRRVMKSGKAYYGFETLARLNRNGQLEDCYFNFVYAPFQEGEKITGVQVVASEVTAQVQAKKALEASEERFRNFIHSAPVPIALYTGREMRIRIANESVLHTWNRDATVIGKTFLEALPELEGTPWMGILQEVYDTGIPFTATEERVDLLQHGKLEMFYFNFTYKPLYDGQGKIFGVINTAADVTKLVLARQQLMQTQAQLHSAIESAQMATWRIDLAAGIAYFSPRLRSWFGFSTDEIKLEPGFAAIHPADRPRVLSKLQSILTGNSNDYSDEYRVLNQQDQTVYFIRVTARVYRHENGDPYELAGVAMDITGQKLMEQKLEQLVQQRTEELSRANQHLKQSNEELEQFAYVASHDLQEPLRKIRIFSGMLMNQLQLLPEQHRHSDLLEKVISSAERMSQLIMDLLNYSHITKKEELFQPVDLNMVLQQVREDFELLIKQKEAIIDISELPVIEAIPLQMNQLFYNLAGNALKFTSSDKQPHIKINARKAIEEDLAAHPALTGKEYWLITISDNGIGFEPGMSKLIFTIFQRLHPKNRFEGTGIGLALCKRILLTHGGAIEATGEPGEGAIFTLLLPTHQA